MMQPGQKATNHQETPAGVASPASLFAHKAHGSNEIDHLKVFCKPYFTIRSSVL
jgi:hypothetical protein